MPKASQINFPAIDLNTKVIDGQQFVWDALRGKYFNSGVFCRQCSNLGIGFAGTNIVSK